MGHTKVALTPGETADQSNALNDTRTTMTAMQPRFSRRSIAIAVALGSVASLAIGVHAAPSTRALDVAKAIPAEQSGNAEKEASRIALVIGIQSS